jgi:hypothetical protein
VGRPQKPGQQGGQSLRDALQRSGLTDLEPGAVVTVPDGRLSFPHNLRRKPHQRRFGVILSNAKLCLERASPLLVFVPMTHSTEIIASTDLLIAKTTENGLESDSLAQLALIQPIMKTSIIGKMGVLGASDWDALIERLVWMADRE